MTLLTTSVVIAFAFPIGELPADLRFEPALGGRSLASGFHPRTDLEVAPLAGNGDETRTNVEHGEAPPLIVVGVGNESPVVTTRARVCLLETLLGERLDLLEGEPAAVALLRLERDPRHRLWEGDPAHPATSFVLGASPHQEAGLRKAQAERRKRVESANSRLAAEIEAILGG